MEKINGIATIALPTETIASINELIERNECRPAKKGDRYDVYTCPNCHIYVSPDDYFCKRCGQRLKDNEGDAGWKTVGK